MLRSRPGKESRLRRAALFRLVAVAALSVLAAGGAASGWVGAGGPAPVSVPSAVAELAPGELGKARGRGKLALAAFRKSVYLLDNSTGELTEYRENGKAAGDPVTLARTELSFRDKPLWLAVGGSQVGVATLVDVAVFDLDGSPVAYRQVFGVSSFARLANGEWGLGLSQGPGFWPDFSRSQSDGPRARVVSLGSKLELSHSGLLTLRDYSRNQGAARSLILVSAPPTRAYAVEIANYRIYELTPRLKLLATLIDPKLLLEGGGTGAAAEQEQAQRDTQVKKDVRRITGDGKGVTIAPAPPAATNLSVETFVYRHAVLAAGWDDRAGRLVLLLNRGIVGPEYTLDSVDPVSGDVYRLSLRIPEAPEAKTLSQLAVSEGYVWLRTKPGDQPIWRVDREALVRSVRVGTLTHESD